MSCKAKLLGVLWFCLLSGFCSVSFAANDSKNLPPSISEIIGGSYSDPSRTPYAFIFSYDYNYAQSILEQDPNADLTGYVCSGTLVSKQHVLTAGHCIVDQWGARGVVIWIAGKWYTASSISKHPSYVRDDIASPDIDKAWMNIYTDIGMLTLSKKVENVSAMPILVEDELNSGERLVIAGFGSNERSDSEEDNLRNFRTTTVRVDASNASAVRTSYSASSSSACGGDSGGPVVKSLSRYRGLVAVTSQGDATQVLESGKCVRQVQGNSTYYPRLQSEIARSFLRQFSGLTYISSRNINFTDAFAGLKSTASTAFKASSIRSLRSRANKIISATAKLKTLADSKRAAILLKIEKAARSAKSATKVSTAQKSLKQVSSYVIKINALGIK